MEMDMSDNFVNIQTGKFEEVLALAFSPTVALSELIKNASDACSKKNDTIIIKIDTKNRSILIKDNGIGLSKSDITKLRDVGYSDKMRDGNNLSAIGEPYAGSKGLGLLTAFYLCEDLEIRTFSEVDKCAYKITWRKGTNIIKDLKIDEDITGTELYLHNISIENISYITLEEELKILYMTSINYYIENHSLPIIQIYVDEVLKSVSPIKKIDQLYESNKKGLKNKGYFVAKASFKYSKGILTLSYEDNIENVYCFSDEKIQITDINSIISFLKSKQITLNRYRDMFIKLEGLNCDVDDFEGVYYIWRDKKNDEIVDYPYGIRIYVNNYGLYSYLNQDYDWLGHSEISQNKKASNLKLKNTYGYVCFTNYNEPNAWMKIAKERNDFEGTLAKRKFSLIMREFVSGIFSDIDIKIKNYVKNNHYTFRLRHNKRNIVLGNLFNLKELLNTDLIFDEIEIKCENTEYVLGEDGDITFNDCGQYHFSFQYEERILEAIVNVLDPAPNFTIKKKVTVDENNSYDLRLLINRSKLENIELAQIEISSDEVDIKNGMLSPHTPPGTYTIYYKYTDEELEICHTAEVTVKQINSNEAKKIKKLFGDYYKLVGYDKTKEIIDGIAACHINYPTICMFSLRVLTEILLKDFFAKYCLDSDYNNDGNLPGKLEAFLNRAFINSEKNNVMKKLVDQSIQNKYFNKLNDGNIKKRILKSYNNLELNLFVHNPEFKCTSGEFKQSLNIMIPVYNLIIEALLFE